MRSPPCIDTNGLVPTSIQTSQSSKRSRPAAQLPRRALATHFADWSMVIVENRLWDPTARSHAPAKLNVSDAV